MVSRWSLRRRHMAWLDARVREKKKKKKPFHLIPYLSPQVPKV